jgi:hypothetical protein
MSVAMLGKIHGYVTGMLLDFEGQAAQKEE